MRRANRFQPSVEPLSLRIAPSGIGSPALSPRDDTNMPETGHLNPVILEPVTAPPSTLVA